MSDKSYILTIDQGTTSTRIILFNQEGRFIDYVQKSHQQFFPHNGWVEHNPEEIWKNVYNLGKEILLKNNLTAESILTIGITNQRETTILWNRKTGKAVYPAIVWQDRRTAEWCDHFKEQGLENKVIHKTGLVLDPYFSVSKIAWILNSDKNLKQAAQKGEIAFGTMDSFLLWHLTEGKVHATDVTNASRTLLYNIHDKCWDLELLSLFDIPIKILPAVLPNSFLFGYTSKDLWGAAIPITGMIGDQQAALVGQACLKEGMIKATYGTGGFILMNIGKEAKISEQKLLTTIAYQTNDAFAYAFEGSFFMAGASVEWLCDKLELVKNAHETEILAASLEDNQGVYLIPAFTGLGAPYWDPYARGAIIGMTRATGKAEVARATLESVVYQTKDLLDIMIQDSGIKPIVLRADGGMVHNKWLMQFLADILSINVDIPSYHETTALGASYIAALGGGLLKSSDDVMKYWYKHHSYQPIMVEKQQKILYKGWLCALQRIQTNSMN
ncbi:MAG: glycerol kinase GlpK [Alphaproteobacteria bacterium]|nr:glycerol kinase GlpK [Alphaproteobacteria bacterium]